MLVHEEKFHNSHQREAFSEFKESHYLGFDGKQTPKYSLERLRESHESFRIASEPEFAERHSTKFVRRDGKTQKADAVQQRLSVFTLRELRWIEVYE
jgi:hypothetical protein